MAHNEHHKAASPPIDLFMPREGATVEGPVAERAPASLMTGTLVESASATPDLGTADGTGEGSGAQPQGTWWCGALETCLVILVAFGHSIFHSVYPLFLGVIDGGWDRNGSQFCRLMDPAAGLALLAYVILPASVTTHGLKASSPHPGASLPSISQAAIGWLRTRWIGLLLVVMVVFGTRIFTWPFSWWPDLGYWYGLRENLRVVNDMLDQALGLGVLAYVLQRRGKGFSYIGLDWQPRDVAFVLPLFLFGILLHAVQWPLDRWMAEAIGGLGWQAPDVARRLLGSTVQIAQVPSGVVNGFFEELIVRAYLMTVVLNLTRRTWVAVVVSVGVQISYHFYQGVPAALSHIPLFTGYAIFFARTRSILPVALAHALVDLYAVWFYGFKTMVS